MSKPIVVGLDIRDLQIAKTGARTYLEEIYKEFQKGRPGFQFYFFDTSIKVYTGRNRFYKLIEQLRFLLWKQLILPLKAFSKGCDIVFCTDYFVPWLQLNYRTVPVFHDAFFWEYPEHYNKYWLMTFRFLGVSAAKRAAFITTPTQYAKERVLQFLPVAPEKIIAIAEAPKSLVSHSELSSGNLKLKTSKYFLHIGVFEKRKNLVVLIEAFHLLRQEGYLDYSLVLAGQASPKNDMDGSADIVQAIHQYGLEEYVILPGYVSDQDLAWYYQHAELYVFPSINEGFGLPVLEAFQYGLPVLVANNTCLPEVGSDAVLPFNPKDSIDLVAKIKTIIDDPTYKAALIARGKLRLQDFSWKKTANELLELFKKVKNQSLCS